VTKQIAPWRADTVCPEKEYPDFAAALKLASHHFADDSGKEWGAAKACMDRAAEIAVSAGWPYWAMKRMYKEISPLPSFDDFMGTYCKRLHSPLAAIPNPTAFADAAKGLVEALEKQHQWHLAQVTPDPEHGYIPADEYSDSGLCETTCAALAAYRQATGEE
jgi:hypothetical protein